MPTVPVMALFLVTNAPCVDTDLTVATKPPQNTACAFFYYSPTMPPASHQLCSAVTGVTLTIIRQHCFNNLGERPHTRRLLLPASLRVKMALDR